MIIRYIHPVRHLLIIVLQLSLFSSTLAQGAGITVDHNSVDLSFLLDSDIAKAASLRVLMRHASVGQGINWGLDCLAGLHPTNPACSDFPAGKYDRTNWLFELRGGNWQEKVDDLVVETVSRANDFDVFMMKFCYIDALGDNHPDWNYFRSRMELLEADFPDKRFVWWTIPLTRDGQAGTDVFNARMRSYCIDNDKILFDIADIECHDPDGTKLTNAQGNEVISQNYTKEIHAGHLNIEGRIRVASALWRLMAAIAEDFYEPDALELLTPNGGQRWMAGKTYTISWSYTGSIGLVVIEYSTDLGASWTAVGQPVPADSGGCDWHIPAVNSNQCLIRVSSAEDPTINDTSDEVFTIFVRTAIYVDDDAVGNNDGTSWENAFIYLQDALATARMPDVEKPLEIRVAQGIYKPNQGLIPIVAPGTPGRGGPSTGVWPADEGRFATFRLINDVTIKGGYAGITEPDPNARDVKLYESILSGDLNGDDIDVNDLSDLLDEPTRSDNSIHVITSAYNDANAVIDGFTVTEGQEIGWADPGPTGGAGMVVSYGSPTVIECTFTVNSTRQYGGGMFNISSRPTLIDCVFTRNYADSGAGIYNGIFRQITQEHSNPRLINCTFTDNYARWIGGGIYNEGGNSSLLNCTFIRNSSGGFCGGGSPEFVDCEFIQNNGGGIYSFGKPRLTNCIFNSNSTKYYGGGMYSEGNYDIILTDCIFSGNSASLSGGGLVGRDLVLNNCIFTGNKVYGDKPNQDEGGGCVLFGDNITMTNCTFYGNWARQGRAISKSSDTVLRINNCIFWDGGDEISRSHPSTLTVTYSDIRGGMEGEGNINVDPLFAAPGYWADANDPDIVVEPNDPNAVWVDGDYHLKSQAGRYDLDTQSWVKDDVTSPCIDAGDPDSCLGFHEPYPNGLLVNMGAFGGTAEASMSLSPDKCIIPWWAYDYWVEVGEPICWCYKRQCHGDADCKHQGKQKYWVSTNDLDVLIAAWNKTIAEIEGKELNGVPLICADFDHIPQGKAKYPVSTMDLDILIAYWNIANKPEPDCP